MIQSARTGTEMRVSVLTPTTSWALVALSLSMLLSSLATSMANVALPTLARAFSAPFGAVQWVVLAYLVSLTAAIIAAGRLGDVLGRRTLLRAGLAVFTVAALVCGLAPGLWLLVAARAVQGVAAAAMMALPLAFVGEIVPAERTGGAMGLLGTTSAVGTALGPSLGGALIDWLGWQAPFFVQVPLGLITLSLAGWALPAARRSHAVAPSRSSHRRPGRSNEADPDARQTSVWPPEAGHSDVEDDGRLVDVPAPTDRSAERRGGFTGALDVPGTVLLAVALACYSLAVTLGRGHFGVVNGVLGLGAAISVALLVRTERRTTSPLLSPAVFRSPATLASLAANMVVSAVVMATLVVGPFHLSRALGLDTGEVGLVMSFGPLVAALAGVPAGRLVDRIGPNRAVRLGLLAVLGGAAALAAASRALGVPGYVAPVAVLTAGYALFQAANNTAVMRNVAPEARGLVSGTLTLSRNLGLITGASVMGALFLIGAGDVGTAAAEAITAGTRMTFGAASGLLVLVILALEGRTGGAP